MRRLALRREALAELTALDLATVAGGRDHTVPDPQCVLTLPSVLRECLPITDPCGAL